MVTIADVARAAGVSPSTVSYVLSGSRPISAETRERVRASISQLGYQPHAGARALARQRTDVLALVVPLREALYVPVIMQFVSSVAIAARAHDHDVLLLTKDEGTAGLHRVAGGAMVDALIVMDVEADDERVPVLLTLRQPAVLIGLPARPAGLSCVDLDFAATGQLAVAHLAEHGHRTIALVGPPAAVYERGTSYATRFLDGFTDAVRELGVEALARPCEPSHEGAADWLARIDEELPGVTGLVVHNESVVGPLLGLLRASGRRVPEDVSIVAVCPEDVALGQPVQLTSIDIPAQQLGALAVELVLHVLDEGGRAQSRLLAPALTERDSCGPPPPGPGDHQVFRVASAADDGPDA